MNCWRPANVILFSSSTIQYLVSMSQRERPPIRTAPPVLPVLQVRYAFVAGVVLCLALLPVNRALATKIQSASTDMMGAKDQRVRVMGQALRNIRVVKMLSWEPACVLAVSPRMGLRPGFLLLPPCPATLYSVEISRYFSVCS